MKNILLILFIVTAGLQLASAQTGECRRDTLLYYDYTPGTNLKTLKYRRIYSYDANNNETMMLRQGWVLATGTWVNMDRSTSVYNASNLIVNSVDELWNAGSGTWINDEQTIHTYDGQNNISTTTTEFWNTTTNAWQNLSRLDFNFDANGNLYERYVKDWNTGLASWQYVSLETSMYDANNNRTALSVQLWNTVGGGWAYDYILVEDYNAENRLIERVRQHLNNTTNAFENVNRYTYMYDSNGNEIQRTFQTWNETDNNWNFGQRKYSTYNAANNLEDYITRNWNPLTFSYSVNVNKAEYTYDASDNLLVSDFKVWNSSQSDWMNNSMQIREYDSENVLKAYEFKSNWNPTNNYFNVHFREEYICSIQTEPVSMDELNLNNLFRVFPNPVSSGESLHVQSGEKSQFRIMDLSGRVLLEGLVHEGIQTLSVDFLSSGIYLLQLEKNTIKLIKN